MKARRMPYRKQFTGSPWQQGGPAFGMNQMGGGMGGSGFDGFGGSGPMGMGGMDNQFAMGMMGSGFGRNQGYGGYGGMNAMGMNMGYGMGNMSRMKDRRGNQQSFRNQRKRPLQSRSPVGGQRNKRANYDGSVNQRNRVRRRSRNNKMGGRNNYGRQGRNTSAGRRRRPEGQRGKEDEDKDSESVDGELYNPAEPTDDFSEYEYEDGDDMDEEQEGEKKEGDDSEEKAKTEEKAEKAEGNEEGKPEEEGKSEEKGEDADKEKAKNGIQVTIQQGAKGRSVSQEKKAGAARKSLVCHVCKIVCSTQEKFRNHMNGRGHKEKMETLLVLQREKAQALEARMKASHHMRTDSSKGSGKGKKNQNWCTVCECAFVGNFLSHRRTKEHRRKRDKKYPKCRPCRMGFSNADEYKEHCTSEEHKKKASQFHSTFRSQESDDDYVIVDATGIFEDEDRKKHQDEKSAHAISEQLKDLMQEEPAAEEIPSPEKEKPEETENPEEDKNEEKDKDEEKPVATSAVLLVNGYYCKLCYKFFGGGAPAKIEHCKNKRHIDNYKRSLPRPKKESEKDKEKEADKAKDEDKADKGEENKDKEECDESKATADEKSDEPKVAAEKDGTTEDASEKTDSLQPEVEESSEKGEAMDTADATKEEPTKNDATEEVESAQETVEKEKPDADASMEVDEKDQSFVSAKDTEEETETAEKEEDAETTETTEKSSPGVRRGRSARSRGRKRT